MLRCFFFFFFIFFGVMCLSDSETRGHPFGCCSYAYGYWTSMLKAFGWSLVLPHNVFIPFVVNEGVMTDF